MKEKLNCFMDIFKKIVYFLLLLFLFIQCSNENKYLIEKGKVGLLSTKTTIIEMESIFANDSIVRNLSELKGSEDESFFNNNDEYEIYSKKGLKLLEIVPVQQNDSTSKLKSIQIFDSNFRTNKGIGLLSTFKEINSTYIINKVETTLTSATLYIDELNATIAIDKEELGLSKFSREEIALDQIPDVSKIKYFTIWFN